MTFWGRFYGAAPTNTSIVMNTTSTSLSTRGGVLKWVFAGAGLFIAGLLGLMTLLMIGSATGPLGLIIGFVLATLPAPIYVGLALWLDRIEAEPPWMLVGAFVWGATAAVFFAFIFNTLNGLIVAVFYGAKAGEAFTTVVSAPFVEESAKAFVLFLLFFWKKDEFDGIVDGIVYASMVGLGFAMTENIQYYGKELLKGGLSGSAYVFLLRGIISPFSHPLFTSMTGIGLGLARQSDKGYVKFLAPLAGLGLAMFLHFLWNASASLGPLFLVAYLFVMAPAFLGVLTLVYLSLQREGQILREHLWSEVQNGLLTRQEYESLSSGGGRLRASWGAMRTGGVGGWRVRGQFHQTASELAFHRRRVHRRGMAGQPETARLEDAYLQRLRELRTRL